MRRQHRPYSPVFPRLASRRPLQKHEFERRLPPSKISPIVNHPERHQLKPNYPNRLSSSAVAFLPNRLRNLFGIQRCIDHQMTSPLRYLHKGHFLLLNPAKYDLILPNCFLKKQVSWGKSLGKHRPASGIQFSNFCHSGNFPLCRYFVNLRYFFFPFGFFFTAVLPPANGRVFHHALSSFSSHPPFWRLLSD